jgi:DNA-binding transcriptional LysR family regulator
MVLPDVLARFHAERPGIDLVVHEAGSRDLLQRLAQGEVEVALVILPVQEETFATVPLLREELVLAVPRDHAFARRRRIAVASLRDVPLVMFREGYDLRAVTVAACQRAGFEPTFALEGGEMDGVLRMVAAGLGVAVVPRSVVTGEGALVAVRLSDPTLERTIGLAHRRDWTLSPAADRFSALLVRMVGQRGMA